MYKADTARGLLTDLRDVPKVGGLRGRAGGGCRVLCSMCRRAHGTDPGAGAYCL